MGNKQGLLQSFTGMLYLAVQSLFWFNGLHFLFRRLEIPPLPEMAIFWLLLAVWVILMPLPYMAASQRAIWMIATLIAGGVVGFLLVGDIGTVVILLAGTTWFSLKKIVAGIGAREFIFGLMSIMIFFGIAFIFSYFISIDATEVSILTRFFILAFILTMIGIVVTQLRNDDGYIGTKSFLKQWGIYNGWVWGMLAVLSVGSIIVLLILFNLLPFIRWIVMAILTPIVNWAFLVVLPWLQSKLLQLVSEAPEEETEGMFGDYEPFELDETVMMSPTANIIWNIVLYGLAIIIIAVIAYKFYQFVQKSVKKITDSEDQKRDVIIVEDAESHPEQHSTWRDKFLGIFKPYSRSEEHLLRKEYRQLLKLLRKKEIWTSDAMTVQQLNQIVQVSEYASRVYEKLRYGDHELTEEEVRIGREELRKIMSQIKK